MTVRTDPFGSQWIKTAGLAAISGLALWISACACPAAQAPVPEAAPAVEPIPGAPSSAGDKPPSAQAPTAEASGATAPPVELSYTKTLSGVSTMAEALGKVKSALAAQGFGVITEIDIQSVMKKKLGVEMKPYWILGACNPKKAHRAIEADPQMGLLLPCKVIVYQDAAGAFIVAFARPKAIFGLVDHPQLSSLADEVDTEIRAAFDAL